MTAIADYSGQLDFFDPRQFQYPIHIIGMGGIGGTLALPLVKHGIRTTLNLWDDDGVEPHNLAGQMIYRPVDVGRAKVAAAAEILTQYKEPTLQIIAHNRRVDTSLEDDCLSGIVISGVDSMAARAQIWKLVQFNPEVSLYLDGRIGGEHAQLFALNPCDDQAVQLYEQWLISDDQATPLPCAGRTNSYAPLLLAGRILTQLSLFARGEPVTLITNDHLGYNSMDTTIISDGQVVTAMTTVLGPENGK